ncbi:MAG: nuclear transport factor 2 family protein [Deltaproteobacteria bacterium]|nr:nuclear transport factor 2 family protein [Deltaproteobacteria bacterium]
MLFAELLDEDIVYEIPQTKERIRGRENYTAFNATYPGDWKIQIDRLIVNDNQGVSHIYFHVEGEVMTGILYLAH